MISKPIKNDRFEVDDAPIGAGVMENQEQGTLFKAEKGMRGTPRIPRAKTSRVQGAFNRRETWWRD